MLHSLQAYVCMYVLSIPSVYKYECSYSWIYIRMFSQLPTLCIRTYGRGCIPKSLFVYAAGMYVHIGYSLSTEGY